MTAAHVSGIGVTPLGPSGDVPVADLGHEAALAALADAGLAYDDVGEVFTSSMLSPPQTGIRLAHRLGRTGVPVTAMESASAGGLVALRHAVWAVRSGRCDVALAIGYEKTTALSPGGVVPAPTGPWDRFPPQLHYAIDATRWLHEAGCGPEVLAAVAAKSWNQARITPGAARRLDHEATVDEVLAARVVATPLTRMMCHTACDGGAAAVVTRDRLAGSVAVLAIEQTSRPEDPNWPEEGPVVGPPSQTAMTARLAYHAAGDRTRRRRRRFPPRHVHQRGADHVRLRMLQLKVQRSLSDRQRGAVPGAEGSIDKLLMTDADQAIGCAVMELRGAANVLEERVDWDTYVWSRAASIYGGTQQVQRNIVAQRVLGLPRE